MGIRELLPMKQPTGPRNVRDGEGLVWELEPKPGTMGTRFCDLLFEAPRERRWKPFLRGDLCLMSHNQLAHQLRDAKPVPAGKVIEEYLLP